LTSVLLLASARAEEIWRFNAAGVADRPSTIIGRPQRVDLKDGTALSFDGEHDCVVVPSLPTAGSTSFTIEVLFCPAEGGAEAQRFLHMQDDAGRRALLEIRTNGKGGWWLDAFLRTDPSPDDRGLTLIDPQRVHPTGQWYWVAMRYDGHHLADFVNGEKELERAGQFSALGEGKVSIGSRQNLVYWFKGAIREIRFHREALPADKLQR
jgi:hypothetical protein